MKASNFAQLSLPNGRSAWLELIPAIQPRGVADSKQRIDRYGICPSPASGFSTSPQAHHHYAEVEDRFAGGVVRAEERGELVVLLAAVGAGRRDRRQHAGVAQHAQVFRNAV